MPVECRSTMGKYLQVIYKANKCYGDLSNALIQSQVVTITTLVLMLTPQPPAITSRNSIRENDDKLLGHYLDTM